MKHVLQIIPAVVLVKKHGLIDILPLQTGKINYYTNGKFLVLRDIAELVILGNDLSLGKLMM